MAFTPWPIQVSGIEKTLAALNAGETRICLTAPTGTGKSFVMETGMNRLIEQGRRQVLYSVRKSLTEQIIGQLQKSGVRFGVTAAGFEEYNDPDAMVQLCSVQTVHSRVIQKRIKSGLIGDIGRERYPLPLAHDVWIDEVHLQSGDQACNIFNEHHSLGASLIGVTATPLGVSHLLNRLIVAGNNSDGRDCGALIPAHVFACPEIDTSKIERVATGEFSLADIRKHSWNQAIYGNVHEHLLKQNPDLMPFIVFAPGVDESVGFAMHFRKKGIRVAHIDGEDCWLDGERYTSDREARRQILDDVRAGRIHGLTNRFVLREAIDIKELHCCVLATPIGSLCSYVQIVGRVLRAHESMKTCIINDHGGNWWRHGSPNADRDDLWREYFHDPKGEQKVTDVRIERVWQEKEEVAINCPKCGAVMMRTKGGRCYRCDEDLRKKRARLVIQRDGSLIDVTGLPIKPRREVSSPDMEKAWEKAFWIASKNGKMTFSQARGFIASGQMRGFEKFAGQFPPPGLRLMPKDDRDWFSLVKDVPKERLH